jgi:hypothetical protein
MDRKAPVPDPAVEGVPETVNVANVRCCDRVITVPAVIAVSQADLSAPPLSMRLILKEVGVLEVVLTLKSPGEVAFPEPL